jgi:hypothetical protein
LILLNARREDLNGRCSTCQVAQDRELTASWCSGVASESVFWLGLVMLTHAEQNKLTSSIVDASIIGVVVATIVVIGASRVNMKSGIAICHVVSLLSWFKASSTSCQPRMHRH